jgi:phytoene desaturase
MSEKFDVIVVGAGLGGLSAAGYLAKAGRQVLLLENNPVPGGYAQEFRRSKFRFEAALHAMDGVGPGGWAFPILRDLKVLGRVKFNRLDPIYTVRYPEHEVKAHANPFEYEAELIRHFPHEKDGIRAAMSEMIETYWQTQRFMTDSQLDQRPPMEQIPVVYPKMLAAISISLDEFFAPFIQDRKLRAVFSTLWPYFGLPPSRLNAATFIFPFVSYHLFGGYYPEGGSAAISRALAKAFVELGGEVRYRQKVTRIEIRYGRAVAIETEKGLRAEADAIISNANAPDTLLKLVGRENLPAEYRAKVEATPNSVSTLCVYLGLTRELKVEGFRHHELFLYDDYDLERNYQAMMAGKFAESVMGLSTYDLMDPTCAPEGCSVLTLIALADWNTDDQWGTGGDVQNYRKNPRYLELKEAAGEALIERAEKLIPHLREAIKFKEIATPLTNWRYSQNPGGGIYGSAQSVENTYLNRLGTKTPIPNLFLTGAWAYAGGMSAALLSGQETSRIVNGYLDGKDLTLLTRVDLPTSPASSQPPSQTQEKKPVDGDRLPAGSDQTLAKKRLPDVTIKAVGSGRQVSLQKIGKRAVLLFHTQETADQVAKINQAIRNEACCADPATLMIANVVDLHSVPKLFRGMAEKAMSESYKQAVAVLPAGVEPEEYVVILPDWDGSVTKAAGLKDVNKTAGVIVLDTNGYIAEAYQGDDAMTVVLSSLEKVGRQQIRAE